MRKLTLMAVPLVLLWSAAAAQADAVQVGAFNGGDHIDWSQLPAGFQGSNTAPVTTAGGDSATVTSNGTDLYSLIEGTNWLGGFNIDDAGIAVTFGDGDTLTIDLVNAVSQVGAFVQSDVFGDFTIEMRLFDDGLNLIGGGPFTVSGANLGTQDGSNPFLGAVSDSPNISRIVFALTVSDAGEGGKGGIGIGQLELGPAVPEPVSLSLLGLGLAGYAIRRRRAVR
jgi:hypothetical protein